MRATRLRLPRQPLLRHLLCALAAGAVLYVVTARLNSYNDFQVGEIAAYVVALVGLSLLTGVNGQFSLGNGAFMAVGAYTLASQIGQGGMGSVWLAERSDRRFERRVAVKFLSVCGINLFR